MSPLPSLAVAPRTLVALPRIPNTPEQPLDGRNDPSAPGSAQVGSGEEGGLCEGTGEVSGDGAASARESVGAWAASSAARADAAASSTATEIKAILAYMRATGSKGRSGQSGQMWVPPSTEG
ncbi:MAG TPA: hypothetical protein VK550_34030 [Polyangiaceae bacterium]|nr:hypothetical protein [Polyangiaceae bacterium]